MNQTEQIAMLLEELKKGLTELSTYPRLAVERQAKAMLWHILVYESAQKEGAIGIVRWHKAKQAAAQEPIAARAQLGKEGVK